MPKKKFMPWERGGKYLPHEVVGGPGSAHNAALQGQFIPSRRPHTHNRSHDGYCTHCGAKM